MPPPSLFRLAKSPVQIGLILQLSLKLKLTILTCGLVYAVTNFCTISDHFRIIIFLSAMSDHFRIIVFPSLVNFTVCAICYIHTFD